MQDIIQDQVFSLYPQFVRAVVIAHDLHISEHNPRIATFLSEVQAKSKKDGAQLLKHPRITVWDDAHRKFGSNPNRFPPSIRSLLERVLRGKPLPYINDAVALFNSISLKHLIPSGGDNLGVITGDVSLGLATGREHFTPLGGNSTEYPEVGEVIYFDSDLKVMCRRWNWRNGDETKITTDTHSLLINVDGLGDDVKPVVQEASEEIAGWLQKECGGNVRCDLLHRDRRSVAV